MLGLVILTFDGVFSYFLGLVSPTFKGFGNLTFGD